MITLWRTVEKSWKLLTNYLKKTKKFVGNQKSFFQIVEYDCNPGRDNIRRQNLNEYLETLHLAPTQFCDLHGFYRKTGS